jgi:uroporphyrinogen-III decarboxylase
MEGIPAQSELDKLVEYKKIIDQAEEEELELEEQLANEMEKQYENATNNLKIFETWMENLESVDDVYSKFVSQFDVEYRVELFENIVHYFQYTDMITDTILFYWKALIIDLLKKSRKYKPYTEYITYDQSQKESNLKLFKHKHILKCDIDMEFLCFLKENGTDYYVS